jgi:hypothetical protein
MHCHPSVFTDHYDSVKINNSGKIRVDKFIQDCCGAISIETTNETKEKGKYIVVVPEERIESAREAIGMACLTAYQNHPLVNDNVTVSGHAQRLSEKSKTDIKIDPKRHSIQIRVRRTHIMEAQQYTNNIQHKQLQLTSLGV